MALTFADSLLNRFATLGTVRNLFHTLFTSAAPLEIQTWSPSYGGTGSLTYSSVTTNYAQYVEIGPLVLWALGCQGTTGGTTSYAVTATLPVVVTDASYANRIGHGQGDVTANDEDISAYFASTSTMGIVGDGTPNWQLASGIDIRLWGFYFTE